MNEHDLQFFENVCELPAQELLQECSSTDRLQKWGLSLNPHQLKAILQKLSSLDSVSLAEQRQFFLKHVDHFEEEYLIYYFAKGKSQNLVQNIFHSAFEGQKRMRTTDRLIQLIALYRFQKEYLQTIQSFQKLQRRGCKVYELIRKKARLPGTFEDFVTTSNIHKILRSLTIKALPNLFQEEDSLENPFPSLYCQNIEKTDNSVFIFLKNPQERVFVTPYLSTVGDHRYKPSDIILKFSPSCRYVSVYSSSKLGITVAEHIASYFLKIPVQSRLLQDSVNKSTAKELVKYLLNNSPGGEHPYVSEIQFLDPFGGCILCVSLLKGHRNPLGPLAQKHHFSLESLENLKYLKIVFENHTVNLMFQNKKEQFSIFFTSRSFSSEDRARFQEWGCENYGIPFISK